MLSGPDERGRIACAQTNFEALRDAVLARFEMGPAASVVGTNYDDVGVTDFDGVVSR
ncbi:MAG TPA: hypothetical protein VFK04_12325 [Gemmatimonadaceae bacterium]|nr:hypothetical protein [Gemmatimonadaceae bacterium]